MVITDTPRRERFKQAVFAICGTDEPVRSQLRQVGAEAAKSVGRNRAWGGSLLYMLLHWERYPAFGIHPKLYHAVLKWAGMDALNGKRRVEVLADHVREGAVVLLPSRKCKRRRCAVHFVGPQGRDYCSTSCKQRVAASRRRRITEQQRREKQHGRRSRATTRMDKQAR